jgi:hypothetical protein
MRANSRRSRSDRGGRILPNRRLGGRGGGLIWDHTEETERHRTGITELMQFVGRGVAAVACAERHRAVLPDNLALAFEDIDLMLPGWKWLCAAWPGATSKWRSANVGAPVAAVKISRSVTPGTPYEPIGVGITAVVLITRILDSFPVRAARGGILPPIRPLSATRSNTAVLPPRASPRPSPVHPPRYRSAGDGGRRSCPSPHCGRRGGRMPPAPR